MSHCGAVLLWNDLDGKEMGVPLAQDGLAHSEENLGHQAGS